VVEIEGDGGQELQTDFRSGELGKRKGGDVRYADWRSDELGGLRGTDGKSGRGADGKTGDRMWIWVPLSCENILGDEFGTVIQMLVGGEVGEGWG
jgi:hypothetical protein